MKEFLNLGKKIWILLKFEFPALFQVCLQTIFKLFKCSPVQKAREIQNDLKFFEVIQVQISHQLLIPSIKKGKQIQISRLFWF